MVDEAPEAEIQSEENLAGRLTALSSLLGLSGRPFLLHIPEFAAAVIVGSGLPSSRTTKSWQTRKQHNPRKSRLPAPNDAGSSLSPTHKKSPTRLNSVSGSS